MVAGLPICIAASNRTIAQLLQDFLEPNGWEVVQIYDGASLSTHSARGCWLVLCDVDLPGSDLEAVRGLGRPLVYFSSTRVKGEVTVPEGGVAFLQLPLTWSALDAFLRGLTIPPL